MAKPKRKTLLQSQREKLARQRAARRAAQRAARDLASSNRRSLPARGRTTANSPRARVQRGLTRDRLAKQQLQNFGRALQRTMKQRNAQNKAEQAARGTRGTVTRTAGGAGQLARRSGSSSPTSQRIQPVRVSVEGQKQLPGAKKPAGQLSAAKPKLKPASGGSSGSLPGGSGARNLLKAGSKGLLGKLGAAALVADGVGTAKSLADSLKRGEGYAALPGLNKRLNQGNKGAGGGRATVKKKQGETKPSRGKPIRNRRGRVVGYKPVQPASRGMSNIPPKEGTGKGSPNDKKSTKRVSGNGGGGGGSKSVKKPVRKPKLSGIGPFKSGQGYATAVTGKSKLQRDAEELRKMAERSRARQAEMKKKKKK